MPISTWPSAGALRSAEAENPTAPSHGPTRRDSGPGSRRRWWRPADARGRARCSISGAAPRPRPPPASSPRHRAPGPAHRQGRARAHRGAGARADAHGDGVCGQRNPSFRLQRLERLQARGKLRRPTGIDERRLRARGRRGSRSHPVPPLARTLCRNVTETRLGLGRTQGLEDLPPGPHAVDYTRAGFLCSASLVGTGQA